MMSTDVDPYAEQTVGFDINTELLNPSAIPETTNNDVKSGDTLWNIASQQLGGGVSDGDIQVRVEELMAANNIQRPSELRVDQTLNIDVEGQVVPESVRNDYVLDNQRTHNSAPSTQSTQRPRLSE